MAASRPGAPPPADPPGELPLTDAARRVFDEARAESDRLRHEYVGTEHLLLALTRLPDASRLLAQLGVDADRARAAVVAAVAPGPVDAALAPGATRPLTSRTQQALRLAAESARALGHPGVGVEHLVVGLLQERLNLAGQVLAHHGLTVERALAYLERPGAGDLAP